MAAGAWKIFGAAEEGINRSTIDLDTNTFRMVLVTSAWTPSQTADDTWSDMSANEVAAGGGYSTHGKLLTCTIARTGLDVFFDCDDQTWTASTITAKYAIIVKDADANAALAATDLVLCYCDLNDSGGSVSTTSGPLTITIHASGVFKHTVS